MNAMGRLTCSSQWHTVEIRLLRCLRRGVSHFAPMGFCDYMDRLTCSKLAVSPRELTATRPPCERVNMLFYARRITLVTYGNATGALRRANGRIIAPWWTVPPKHARQRVFAQAAACTASHTASNACLPC